MVLSGLKDVQQIEGCVAQISKATRNTFFILSSEPIPQKQDHVEVAADVVWGDSGDVMSCTYSMYRA